MATPPRAARFVEAAESLRAAVERSGWDGHWYRRAYFDDGTPLGSASNDECRIDSIAQTWAVISGAGDPERSRAAMAEVDAQLVRPDDRMILLFTPPFDAGPLQPGYIKGYVPGIRENGGQYTHAAIWVVQAVAMQGRGGRAVELFDMINPVRHAADPAGVERYRVEPYVVAADVYGRPPHTGRGDGPGTRGRPRGSTGSRSKTSSASGSGATGWSSTRASPAIGRGSRSRIDTRPRPIGSSSITRPGSSAG